jgi:hypothetical protein
MKLTPALKEKNGLVTRVFDPARNTFHPDDAIIDLDTLDFDLQMYYQRIFVEGDLVEYIEPVKSKDKPAKTEI